VDEIARLLEPRIPGLRRYAWALLREHDAADDLVQDTLERAIANWHRRHADGDLTAWLFAIERNLFLNQVRQRRRRGIHTGLDAIADLPAETARQDTALEARDALAGLDRLTEEQRSVLLLVGVEGLSYDQAAQALRVPVGTVMSRLSRARGRMRALLVGRAPNPPGRPKREPATAA
jgi:RNA polymerase sigma factor (sigma-70 family)